VLNKIDLPAADPERVGKELEHLIGIDNDQIIAVSGKTGQKVEQVLDAIIERIDAPDVFNQRNQQKFRTKDMLNTQEPDSLQTKQTLTRALIFDSVFDKYK
jgi:translation elongation factor EF-4